MMAYRQIAISRTSPPVCCYYVCIWSLSECVILIDRHDTGLDEAILGSMNSCGDPEQDSKKIADLLKYGAHSLVSSRCLLKSDA